MVKVAVPSSLPSHLAPCLSLGSFRSNPLWVALKAEKWIGLAERRATRPKALGASPVAWALGSLVQVALGAAAAIPLRREAVKRVLNCILVVLSG